MKVMILSNQTRSMLNFWSVLVRQIQALGHEVVACAPPGDDESDLALAEKGVPVIHYPLDRKGLNPVRDIRSLAVLRGIFARHRPDLLFATTIKPVIYGCMAAKSAHVPKIFATITGLGYAFEADTIIKKGINLLSSMLYKKALSGINGIFFQNLDDVEVFRKAGILSPSAKVFMSRGTGVDTERFAPAPFPAGAVRFLLIGRLLEAKGLNEYARAAASLEKEWPEVCCQLLGQPESGMGSVPLPRIEAWQSEGFIEYLGECRDVRPYIAQSHVIVLPSWREGTPTAIMEAMSMGRPCVVSDAPGCREVVREGYNGFLVPVRDAEALAGAMGNFLRDPAIIAVMGEKGRQLAVADFDADKVAAKIINDMGLEAVK